MHYKPTASEIRNFFAWSDTLDYLVLRPLSHIASEWEITWNHEDKKYNLEDGTFAEYLNNLIDDMTQANPPKQYHDNEDRLAEFVREKLKWPIKKENRRWVGADYQAILEQGGYNDIDQKNLIEAATGRVYAAIERDQMHIDEMEESHQRMLGAVMTIILFHRNNIDGLLQDIND